MMGDGKARMKREKRDITKKRQRIGNGKGEKRMKGEKITERQGYRRRDDGGRKEENEERKDYKRRQRRGNGKAKIVKGEKKILQKDGDKEKR